MITYPVSFFDDPALESRPRLWLEETTRKKLSPYKLMEGELFKKSTNSEFLKNRFFIMFEDRLVYCNNTKERREKGFIFLDMLRVEEVQSADGKKGFLLISNRKTEQIFCSNSEAYEKWLRVFRERSTFRDFNKHYAITKAIGKGSFAIVYQATRYSDNAEFAIKSFDKRKIDPNSKNKAGLINEVNIMRTLNNPSIIRLYEVYETDNHINLVLELLKGGELFEKIIEKGFYTDKDAKVLMYKMLDALNYMHTKGIMHRDIKPENLILSSSENDVDIKIADFGLATYVDLEEQLFKRCGTPGYVAPEVLADQLYQQKVDVYSAGVILYILLTGCSPFYGESYNTILIKNKKGEVSFDFEGFDHKPTPHAISLLKAMLEKDPNKRITAEAALQHEWLGGTSPGPGIMLPGAQEKLKKFVDEKKSISDRVKRKEAERAEELVTKSPVITGRTDAIEEEKGRTFMDSPSMRPAGSKDVDMRKKAIMKNAQAHGYMGELVGYRSPNDTRRQYEEENKSKSNPTTPLQVGSDRTLDNQMRENAADPRERLSTFSKKGGDVSEVVGKLKNLES